MSPQSLTGFMSRYYTRKPGNYKAVCLVRASNATLAPAHPDRSTLMVDVAMNADFSILLAAVAWAWFGLLLVRPTVRRDDSESASRFAAREIAHIVCLFIAALFLVAATVATQLAVQMDITPRRIEIPAIKAGILSYLPSRILTSAWILSM